MILNSLVEYQNGGAVNEYMLLVRNQQDHSDAWPPERHREFLEACEIYIGDLRRGDNLVAAQPLVRDGVILTNEGGDWKEAPLEHKPDIQVGYYHIRAESLEDAIACAKRNPEFAFSPTARVEVRPLKASEPETGFDYPSAG
jgi:hypothetical protein